MASMTTCSAGRTAFKGDASNVAFTACSKLVQKSDCLDAVYKLYSILQVHLLGLEKASDVVMDIYAIHPCTVIIYICVYI